MGVCYHAHANFFVDGKRVTVPAPIDPGTPHAPWFYDWIAAHARELRAAGFTAILYPPVAKTQSGHYNTGDGYGVYDNYDLGSKDQCGSRETRFGDRAQLQRSIAIARACGLDVYIDIVMHQLIGGDNGTYRYLGAHGAPNAGRFPKHPGCFRGATPRRPADPVPMPADDFEFGDELVYVNCDPPDYTTDGMIAYGDWLTRSLDIQGFRVDYAKGIAVAFVERWMTSRAMANTFCVSEYFDANPGALAWWTRGSGMNGRSSVFDFTLHFTLQAMCNDPGFDMRRLDGAGFAARDPFLAATFVDNPDTDVSPGQGILWNKLLAYAFILTTEGYPFVLHKDYAQEPGCYGLKPWIDTLVWIHEVLANGGTTTRWNDDKTIALERLGAPGLLTGITTDPINPRAITCATSFGPNVHLHDYTGHHGDIWTDGGGRAHFTIPSNAFGGGRSYVCFSRADHAGGIAIQGVPTVQTFFGAADLDIPPATATWSQIGRIWCAADTPLAIAVTGATARVRDPDGEVLASHTVHTTGWHAIEVIASGASPVPFELTATYVAPQTL
jgi:alpha-amylase